MKKIRFLSHAAVVAVWLALTVFAWFGTPETISDAERRQLAQMPEITVDSILSGDFMANFEDYTLDQFPARDGFRKIKALFHYSVLHQGDNNGIYIAEDSAAALEYPLNESSVQNATKKFNELYESYLSGSKVFVSVVPDKGFYLAEENGYPAMDYAQLFELVRAGMPWAEYVDITDLLSTSDYYRTDTHWRQEQLLPVAQRLCQALGVSVPESSAFTQTAVERPFYGVYYGQAALPMASETMYLMESDLLAQCTVYNHETGKTTKVYDEGKLTSRDLYDMYLSGAAALLTIENPNAATDRELIVFRDSFGSSLIPLLIADYKTVTVIDIRYIASSLLADYVDFHGQDVLFLYSTLILNSSNSLK